jgi:hypothetical protein
VPWLVLLLAAPALTLLGYLSRQPWLLPLLQVLPAYPILVRDLRDRRPLLAILHMLAWALAIAVTMEALALQRPESGTASVLHGEAYRDEMVRWVRTGLGRESSPRLFLPEHLIHLSLFAALSLLSGSLLSLILGAVLVNYMSFYVGSLLALARHPGTVLLFGWPPWAILRVIAFVILGVVLAGPMLQRVLGIPFHWEKQRSFLLSAGALLILDAVLKAFLAPSWSALLRASLYPLSPGL